MVHTAYVPQQPHNHVQNLNIQSQLSFEEVVLKGLAADGGLFVPEEIPTLPSSWASDWRDLSFQDLAFEILSMYISPSEIPAEDLKEIVKRSYASFRHPDVTPLVLLDEGRRLFLLELFHGRECADQSWLMRLCSEKMGSYVRFQGCCVAVSGEFV